MLAWVKNAPTFDDNTEAEVKAFVDSKITCRLPHDDQDLQEQLLFTRLPVVNMVKTAGFISHDILSLKQLQ
jgi:hypothetical protein